MFGLGDLFDRHGTVDELVFDDAFFEHLAQRATFDKHRVSLAEILQAHQTCPRYYVNVAQQSSSTESDTSTLSSGKAATLDAAAQRRAPIVMLGATNSGRVLKVPLVPTDTRGIWRPITAFQANTHDRQRYEEGQANE